MRDGWFTTLLQINKCKKDLKIPKTDIYLLRPELIGNILNVLS